jgi:Flp pilus assembly protein TadD
MLRSTPRLLALLLAASALSGCTTGGLMGNLSGTPKRDAEVKAMATSPKTAANDLDGNLRQAQLLRAAGSYDDAIHILSQLMLAAADDPRVSAEYGKTLAQKGRANDATQFLRRAIELAPNDWTLYSALGVSYDQLNDPANARLAYDHALLLKPGEASVLNNYALSRMLAKDPDGARLLISQAQAAAGGMPDAKIMRNVALINGMAPDAIAAKPTAMASAIKPTTKLPEPKLVTAPPPPKVAMTTPPLPAPLPAALPRAANANGAPQNANDVARLLASQSPVADTATGAPRPLAPQLASAQSVAPAGVVMQAVPYDPFAGPVLALKKPKPRAVAKASAPKTDTATADSDKAEGAKPQKTAAAKSNVVPSLRIAADNY